MSKGPGMSSANLTKKSKQDLLKAIKIWELLVQKSEYQIFLSSEDNVTKC